MESIATKNEPISLEALQFTKSVRTGIYCSILASKLSHENNANFAKYPNKLIWDIFMIAEPVFFNLLMFALAHAKHMELSKPYAIFPRSQIHMRNFDMSFKLKK